MNKSGISTGVVLFTLWLLVTAFNITKAVHIDDTAYLEIARNLVKDPLHPLSGKVNWGNSAEPAFHINQPVLLSYLYCMCMAVFGQSEIALHLLMAFFSGLAILMFFRVSKLLVQTPIVLTALFCAGPAFIPSQNLMTDVPVTALVITFLYLLMRAPLVKKPLGTLCLAACVATLACLIKYTSIVLLVVLVLDLARNRQWKSSWILFIPLGVLGAWSWFNIADYGQAHLFTRSTDPSDYLRVFKRVLEWLAGLGSITPFAFLCVPYLYKKRGGGRIILLCCCTAAFPALSWSYGFLHRAFFASVLEAYFYVNGLLLISSIAWALGDHFRTMRISLLRYANHQWPLFLLLLWLAGSMLFTVMFAHFVAIRHILISFPSIVLIFGLLIVPHLSRRSLWIALGFSVCMGIWVSVSDWEYADIYRTISKKISKELGCDKTIWHTGHWGWQWYAAKAGMRQYDAATTQFKPGDLLVMPHMVNSQEINKSQLDCLAKYREIVVGPSPFMFLRTMHNIRGYYAISVFYSPWTFSRDPVDTFTVFSVIKTEPARTR